MRVNDRDRRVLFDMVSKRVRVLTIEATVAELQIEKGTLEAELEAGIEGNPLLAAAIDDLAGLSLSSPLPVGQDGDQASAPSPVPPPVRRGRGRKSQPTGSGEEPALPVPPPLSSDDYGALPENVPDNVGSVLPESEGGYSHSGFHHPQEPFPAEPVVVAPASLTHDGPDFSGIFEPAVVLHGG